MVRLCFFVKTSLLTSCLRSLLIPHTPWVVSALWAASLGMPKHVPCPHSSLVSGMSFSITPFPYHSHAPALVSCTFGAQMLSGKGPQMGWRVLWVRLTAKSSITHIPDTIHAIISCRCLSAASPFVSSPHCQGSCAPRARCDEQRCGCLLRNKGVQLAQPVNYWECPL